MEKMQNNNAGENIIFENVNKFDDLFGNEEENESFMTKKMKRPL